MTKKYAQEITAIYADDRGTAREIGSQWLYSTDLTHARIKTV
mgnify:FL=1